ncbi:MAG: hypothetical protein ACXAEU_01535 [Candidatus Hodarchaeales archaeon]
MRNDDKSTLKRYYTIDMVPSLNSSPRGKVLELFWKPVTRASPVLSVHKLDDIPKRNPRPSGWGGCQL